MSGYDDRMAFLAHVFLCANCKPSVSSRVRDNYVLPVKNWELCECGLALRRDADREKDRNGDCC